MDFVILLPRSQNQYDSIWVIINRMSKSTHFFPVRTNFSVEDYAKLFLKEIMKFHSASVFIILDHGPLFSSHFWKSFQKVWELRCALVLISTRRWMVKQRELSKL